MNILFVILAFLAFLAVVAGRGARHDHDLHDGSSAQSIIGGTPTSRQEYPFFVVGEVSETSEFVRLRSDSSTLTASFCRAVEDP